MTPLGKDKCRAVLKLAMERTEVKVKALIDNPTSSAAQIAEPFALNGTLHNVRALSCLMYVPDDPSCDGFIALDRPKHQQ